LILPVSAFIHFDVNPLLVVGRDWINGRLYLGEVSITRLINRNYPLIRSWLITKLFLTVMIMMVMMMMMTMTMIMMMVMMMTINIVVNMCWHYFITSQKKDSYDRRQCKKHDEGKKQVFIFLRIGKFNSFLWVNMDKLRRLGI